MSCNDSIASRSSARTWGPAPLQIVPVSQLTPGAEVSFDLLKTGRTRNLQGDHAHVTALRLTGSVSFDRAAGNAPMTARQVTDTILNDLFIRDITGHYYVQGVRPSLLEDDAYLRSFRPQTTAPDILRRATELATSPGGDVGFVMPFTIDIPFAAPDAQGLGQLRGVVPLAAFERVGAITFRIPQSPDGGMLGVTYNGHVSALELWAEVVYLPQAVFDTAWSIEQYDLLNDSGALRHPGRVHEYAYAYDAASGNTAGFDGIQTMAGPELLIASLRNDQWQRLTLMDIADDRNAGDAEPSIYADNGNLRFGMLVGARQGGREGLARGAITYRFAARPSPTTRVLHRTLAPATAAGLQTLSAALGMVAPSVTAIDGGRANQSLLVAK